MQCISLIVQKSKISEISRKRYCLNLVSEEVDEKRSVFSLLCLSVGLPLFSALAKRERGTSVDRSQR